MREVARITDRLKKALAKDLRKRGLVVALSGGIDSSVTTALAIRAVGPERVFVLLMPERQSSPETLPLSMRVVEAFKAAYEREDITPILEAVGFYRRYDQAVSKMVPDYGEGWQSKIVLPSVLAKKGFSVFSIVARSPDGATIKKRLTHQAYLEIVAATNFKQRIRKMLEYYHADRLNYAVAGTPNRLEYDQGFFVKLGDGAADIKPIAHLYKSQVYQLAKYLGVPEEICNRPPTTDTYSMPQGQDEFYFSLPYDQMDLCLYAKNNDIAPEIVAPALGLSADQIQRIYEDIDIKRSTTRYLHASPVLIETIDQIAETH
jgi:NAD+ synthase